MTEDRKRDLVKAAIICIQVYCEQHNHYCDGCMFSYINSDDELACHLAVLDDDAEDGFALPYEWDFTSVWRKAYPMEE